MHRASPTLLLLAACCAGSLLTAAPALADEPPGPVLLGTASSAAASDEPAPSPSPAEVPTPSAPASASSSPFDPPPSPLASSPLESLAATATRPNDRLVVVSAVMAGTAGSPSTSLGLPRARLPLKVGHYGSKVSRLQQRLEWLGYQVRASNTNRQAFGTSTKKAVTAFQVKNWLPATGKVDRRTWRLLAKHAEPVGVLPLRCTEVKRALCIDKTTKTLRLVEKGEVTLSTDARFGAPGMETGEGVFTIKEKSFNHTSTIYRTWMPRAMFFNGDEAVHYSPDFNAVGYLHGSHGCVGVRDLDVATTLFEKVPVGTRVYVYWS